MLINSLLCCHIFIGAPVDVGMSIDIASIDMVSEVNMVSFRPHSSTRQLSGEFQLQQTYGKARNPCQSGSPLYLVLRRS